MKDKKSREVIFTCPSCNTENIFIPSGCGKIARKCTECGNTIMVTVPEITNRDIKTISKTKLRKLPKEIREKIELELNEIEEKRETKEKSYASDKAKVMIDYMIKEGMDIDNPLSKEEFKKMVDVLSTIKEDTDVNKIKDEFNKKMEGLKCISRKI
jgi:TRAP-type C4-dicarboxylate transport system substrate-binding protein